ncbi:MAG: DUF2188 domain-containing protein [Halobacteria archaeon]|nr:DUF2188 domain-containing protein [Halobacteria archaeon]
MTTVYHIIAEEKEWEVVNEGEDRVISHHKSKREALRRARKLAKEKERETVEVIVHRPDGEVERRYSFGSR